MIYPIDHHPQRFHGLSFVFGFRDYSLATYALRCLAKDRWDIRSLFIFISDFSDTRGRRGLWLDSGDFTHYLGMGMTIYARSVSCAILAFLCGYSFYFWQFVLRSRTSRGSIRFHIQWASPIAEMGLYRAASLHVVVTIIFRIPLPRPSCYL